MQLAAMQLDQRLGDRQAETGALVLAGQMVFDLFEGFEHLFELLARDADAGIAYCNHQIPACPRALQFT